MSASLKLQTAFVFLQEDLTLVPLQGLKNLSRQVSLLGS